LAVDGNYFDQIPDELATDELRKITIKLNPTQISYMHPKDTAGFDELMTMALRESPGIMTSIDLSLVSPAVFANHITERAMAKRCYPGGKNVLDYFLAKREWGCEAERIQYVNDMVIFNQLTFDCLNINDITDETIVKSWVRGNTSYSFFSKIDESGRDNVYMKMAREEHWPSGIERPESLNKAVWRVMRLDETDSGDWQLLRAYIKNHPVEDVCRYMTKNRARVDMLAELFTAEEILPYIKENSMAKSQVLKSDMGL
jgi:hypothetical protein